MCIFCYVTRTWLRAVDFEWICLHVGIPLMMIRQTTLSKCYRRSYSSKSRECIFWKNCSRFATVTADLNFVNAQSYGSTTQEKRRARRSYTSLSFVVGSAIVCYSFFFSNVKDFPYSASWDEINSFPKREISSSALHFPNLGRYSAAKCVSSQTLWRSVMLHRGTRARE